jgi:hypothetical protein
VPWTFRRPGPPLSSRVMGHVMGHEKAAHWHVRSHGPIVPLAENLWWVTGSIPMMSLKRVMAIARRTDGRLVIHSAIAMAEEQMRELEALGEPAFLVVPSSNHRIDAPAYKKRYPGMKVLAPRGAVKGVEPKVHVEGVYEDYPADDAVSLEPLAGMKESEGLMRVRSKDGTTLVFNDAVFNMDRPDDVLGYCVTAMFGSAPGPRVSRVAKLAIIGDQRALRADLTRLAETPDLVRLMVAHEKVAHGADAAAALRQAATFLS